MGNSVSLFTRPLRKINVVERAHKVIGREKPVPAPIHKSTKKLLKEAKAANPTFMEDHYKKDAGLDERLKNIWVQSHDSSNPEVDPNAERPLPHLTRAEEDFKWGFWEPQETSPGKCTLGTTMEFMASYMQDPVKNSPEQIALKYNLDINDVRNVLEYFRVFKVVVPDKNEQLAYTDRAYIEPVQKKQE